MQDTINLEERVSQSSQPVDANKVEDTYTNSTLGVAQTLSVGEQKILGIRWNVAGDQFIIDVSAIAALAKELEPTKTNVVSIVGRFYDPLGSLSPVVIQFKIFFQELCRMKLDWDQTLEGEVLRKWRGLTSDLDEGTLIIIPRYFLSDISQRVKSYRLCGFCDASKSAYAAMVYLIIETAAGIYVKLVAAKTRVSPLQQQTIPRLKLLSAVILARLMANFTKTLQRQMPLSTPICYTDSQVALYWIIGVSKELKQFVQNRVSEIRRLIPITSWDHCASKDRSPIQRNLTKGAVSKCAVA